MDKNWYYLDSDLPQESRRIGPLSRQELEALSLQGKLRKEFLVWYPGLLNWQTWQEISPDFPGNSPEHRCSSCTGMLPEAELDYKESRWVCKTCQSSAVATPETPPQVAKPVENLIPEAYFAPFSIRLAAFLVDLLILGAVNAVLVMIYMFLFHIPAEVLRNSLAINFPGLVLEGIYQVYFLSQYGGTPGKMFMGLRVTGAEGQKLTLTHALGRYFSFWLTAATLGIGMLIVLWDPKRRALHDHIASTRVIFDRARLK